MAPTSASAATPLVPQGFAQACAPRPGLVAHCLTLFKKQPRTNKTAAVPDGLGATDLRAAYQLPATPGPGSTVAVAIAYHSLNLESDLAAYRSQYGLPACTSASGCLKVENQDGNATPLPDNDPGWEVEESLDVSMISASCPTCHILVVEAKTPSLDDLAAAGRVTAGKGAKVVSNSYGLNESGATQAYASAYDQPGHQVVVSTGDAGFTAASFPANGANVIAVGGTELTKSGSARGFDESAWLYGGGGCSAYVDKPARQHDPNCSMRTTADVSAAGDNIAMYNQNQGGWLTIGGTSASAPFIAGMYGQANDNATVDKLYQHPEVFNDITTGTNDPLGHGRKCGNDYLCTAQPGYDGPTGVGTPKGLTAF
ncbi:S53 family peptidase [Fodinicola feengrottensis]|uniref:S53 family peptidase n=1 Tax=Fodinicola feengrottensis TaxID=435914 RepID=UPI0013D27927|nr:S53 family peptidase [Fodinicola feengrottensis]